MSVSNIADEEIAVSAEEEPEKVEIIAVNRVNPVIYQAFSEGYDSLKTEHVATIEEDEPDERYGAEYFISLWQAHKSKHWIIYCSRGLDATVVFDTFWIIFPESNRISAQLIHQKLGRIFEKLFFTDEKQLFVEIETIFKRIDDANAGA